MAGLEVDPCTLRAGTLADPSQGAKALALGPGPPMGGGAVELPQGSVVLEEVAEPPRIMS